MVHSAQAMPAFQKRILAFDLLLSLTTSGAKLEMAQWQLEVMLCWVGAFFSILTGPKGVCCRGSRRTFTITKLSNGNG